MLGSYDGFGGKHALRYSKISSMGSIEKNRTLMELGFI
jgi:hypothetical protein